MSLKYCSLLTRVIIKVIALPFFFFFWIQGIVYLTNWTLIDFILALLFFIVAYKLTELIFE